MQAHSIKLDNMGKYTKIISHIDLLTKPQALLFFPSSGDFLCTVSPFFNVVVIVVSTISFCFSYRLYCVPFSHYSLQLIVTCP